MKFKFYLYLVFLIPILGTTQNVGYMGKKFSVDIGASASPSFAKLALDFPKTYYDSSSNKWKENKPFNIRVYPEVNFAFTLARHWEVSLRMGYQQYKLYYHGIDFDAIDTTYSWHDLIPNSRITHQFYIKENSITTAKSILGEVNLRYYLKKYIAPVGTYITLGYGSYYTKLNEGDTIKGNVWNSFDINDETSYILRKKKLINKWETAKRLSFGIHMKKVFGTNFYFDTGFEMNLMINGKYKDKHVHTYEEDYVNSAYIPFRQRKHLLWENLATLKFSVGIIF